MVTVAERKRGVAHEAGGGGDAIGMVVAHANDPETPSAVVDLLAECDAGLAGRRPRAIVLFAGVHVDHAQVLAALADRYGDVPTIGCTTDGELSSSLSFQEDSIAAMVFVGDGIVAHAAIARDLSDPAAAARAVVDAAGFPGVPKLCVALPESLTGDALAVIEGLSDALPPETVLIGGTAGDQWRFVQTRQFCGRDAVSGSVPILLLGGAIEVGIGVRSGWTPMGRVGRVTRAEGASVYEIDGAPAVAFYQEYFGHHVQPNPEYPTLVTEQDAGSGYLRAPLSYDADTGTIVYTALVPNGAGVQVTTGPTGDVLQACRASAEQAAAEGGPGAAFGALVVSCAARKQILGTRTSEECDILRGALGPDVPVAGFYSYGEIAPLRDGARADFHNETFVTVVFRHARP